MKDYRLTILLACVFAAEVAEAYVPPAEYQVRRVCKRRAAQVKTIRTKSTVTVMEDGHATSNQFTVVTLFDQNRRALRTTAQDELGRDLYSVDTQLPRSASSDLSLGEAIASLLYHPDCSLLLSTLRAVSVPIRLESEAGEEEKRALGRMGERIAYVTGTSAQLWIEKDSFHPLRFLNGDLDLKIEGLRFVKDYPVPAILELKANSENLVLREEIRQSEAGVSLADLRFTPRRGGFTQAGDESPSSIREAIRVYFKLMR